MRDGHIKVVLRTDEQRVVSRIVILAFVGKCPEGYVVGHVNGDNSDNRLENLRYVPRDDIFVYGEDSAHTKFSSKEIARLRRLHANGQTNISALALAVNRAYECSFTPGHERP